VKALICKSQLTLTFPAVISTRKWNRTKIFEENIVYEKVLLGECKNLQILEHCFVS